MILKIRACRLRWLIALISFGLIIPVSPVYAGFSFFKNRSGLEVGVFMGSVFSLVISGCLYWKVKSIEREQQALIRDLDDFIEKLSPDDRAEFDRDVAKITAALESMTDEEIMTFLASYV